MSRVNDRGGCGFDGVFLRLWGFGDGGDGCVEEKVRAGGLDHAVEDLPVAALDGHGAFDGHAYHCFQPVDLIEILCVIDPGGRLDDIMCEFFIHPVRGQELFPRRAGGGQEIQIRGGFGERGEWEMRFLVHFQEGADGLLHQVLCCEGGEAVFPEQLGKIPVTVCGVALLEDERVAIPDTEDLWYINLAAATHALNGEVEFLGCIDEIAVDFDEDGGAELDRFIGVIVDADGGGAATDIVITFVDGDIGAVA